LLRTDNVPTQECQTADSDDADGVIGFGITGQDCCPMGAGFTNYFVSPTENAGQERRSNAWILVRQTCEATVAGGAEQWHTVLKTNGDETFAYASPLWDSDQLLNELSSPDAPGNAKYGAYTSVRLDAVQICVNTPDNCLPPHAFLDPIPSARALFTGPFRREGVQDQELREVFGPEGYRECEPQRPGFNTVCKDGNHARWGYCNNVPHQDCQIGDTDDADGVIGIGIEGQDCCAIGAGWTNWFVNNQRDGGAEARLQAWVKVRAAKDCVPPGWTVVMKMSDADRDETFAYSSPHWTDPSSVLNEHTLPSSTGDAKYGAFNTISFDAIMACVGSLTNCLQPYAFDEPVANAVELFSGDYRREGVRYKEFIRLFDVHGQKKCRPQRPGFNTQCADGNHARWGFCANVPVQECQDADGDDADGVIGFGIEGQDCCPMGAGWSAPCARFALLLHLTKLLPQD